MKKIFLLGYMGSGKSTVGRTLAISLGFQFVDLDVYIEGHLNQSVSEIFESKGELYFRREETKALGELISKKENLVIALGGGTPCFIPNMDLIKSSESSFSFYLRVSIPQLVQRLSKERYKRPLISHLDTSESMSEFIGKHLFERAYYYNQADYTIVCDDRDLKNIKELIISHLF